MSGQRHELPLVGGLMSPEPVLIREDRSLDEAAHLLDEHGISGLPVVDHGGLLVGVLSASDLVRARADAALWSRWDELTVREVMHAPVITAHASMNVVEAAALMDEAHVHRLVVVGDDQQTPVGVISTSDLVRSMMREREG